jgi:hypothetical protein
MQSQYLHRGLSAMETFWFSTWRRSLHQLIFKYDKSFPLTKGKEPIDHNHVQGSKWIAKACAYYPNIGREMIV